MGRHPSREALPPAQLAAERLLGSFERFLHVEAVSGAVLLVAAAAALLWANSPAAASYHALWHSPLAIGIGGFVISEPLHFWINDVLMTVFFLVVGMEVRREIHEGALGSWRLAALPLAAAAGGVGVPAFIYLATNPELALRPGWAVPTATDIAFAVGVLALLGRSIPGAVRIFLLALAIVDDIAAIVIIAVFYSGGVEPAGFVIAGGGMLLVLGFQRIGIGAAYAYVVPGAILWCGLLATGAHPTLAGVVLGMMTPVRPLRTRERPAVIAARALGEYNQRARATARDPRALMAPLKRLRHAQRELLPPVVRVQMALHPWVAYGVMPLFAFANAGVDLAGLELGGDPARVMLGVMLALVLGKPLGIALASWLALRLGACRLPPGLDWRGIWLVGFLGGIGFTMSIFIATLAFPDPDLLAGAKAGVLLASLAAGCAGLALGRLGFGRAPVARDEQQTAAPCSRRVAARGARRPAP